MKKKRHGISPAMRSKVLISTTLVLAAGWVFLEGVYLYLKPTATDSNTLNMVSVLLPKAAEPLPTTPVVKHTAAVVVVPSEFNSAPLHEVDRKRNLVYTFSGTAMCARKPCRNTRISVQIASRDWQENREMFTDDKGHYSLQVPVLTRVNESVDWHLEAQSRDLRQADLTGRHIATDQENDILVENALSLVKI